MSVSSPEQATQPQETSFHFVLCRHEAEMADEIAQSLGNCDVIAFEAVGHDAKTKELTAPLATHYIKDGTSDAERQFIRTGWRMAGLKMDFATSILDKLLDTNKTVALIDATRDDETYESIEQSKDAEKLYFSGIKSGASTGQLAELLENEVRLEADSFRQREELMAKQLDELAARHPGARIGVLVGATHTGVQHLIGKQYQTDRRFAVPESDTNEFGKIAYGSHLEAVRGLRFGIQKGVGEHALKYLLLKDLAPYLQGQESLGKAGDYTTAELDEMLTLIDSKRKDRASKKARSE